MKIRKFLIAIITLILVILVIFFISHKISNQNYETKRYKLGGIEVNLKIADSPEERQKGLSQIYNLDEKEGMIFIFGEPSILSFWNKDTFLDLDVVWIKDDTIVGITPLQKEEKGRQIINSPVPCNIVIELNQGFCQKYNIKIGDKLEII